MNSYQRQIFIDNALLTSHQLIGERVCITTAYLGEITGTITKYSESGMAVVKPDNDDIPPLFGNTWEFCE